jgi:hypothetical protein
VSDAATERWWRCTAHGKGKADAEPAVGKRLKVHARMTSLAAAMTIQV